ncbi:RNA polymerase I associated factor, A49-like protein [Halteromyces radiatus]|uniref:RNA polymerase I associated factor, A49-like protein n=1 Tax=Halteromyces radiatus TaxID=101107 RepID=UPI002220E6B4|nr:RNA polymerase I associated factor, A49-like protein [Halteromyces radiatus]KAI8093094.1 RNA polymerase I associated factor, A49-like protein [Halteromyces radiatus]
MGKRKHSETEGKSDKKLTTISLANVSKESETPILATFPGTVPPAETPFTPYKRNYQTSTEKANERVLIGETEKVIFTGSNFGEDSPRDLHCNYYIGVYSKKNQEVTVTPAKVLSMRRKVKALASHDADVIHNKSFKLQRADLGMTFGTAKAKQQLRDEERNMVKTETMLDELADVQREVGIATASLPTQSSLRQQVKSSLPLPSFNMDADSPETAYDLDSIVTQDELNSIDIKDLLKQDTLESVQNWLPYSRSNIINTKIMQIINSTGKKDRHRARLLVYLSYLMAYNSKVKRNDLLNRERLQDALKNPPSIILQGLTDRYTENSLRTPIMADKILFYILVLSLMVSDYTVYPDIIANELSLKSSKAQTLLRNLGCKIERTTVEDAKMAGLDPKTANKKAVLVVPLTFPELSKGGKRK